MNLLVNGEPVVLEPPASIPDLLARYGLAEAPSAVEVNQELVPRGAHAGYALADGDRVEIVTLVGGG